MTNQKSTKRALLLSALALLLCVSMLIGSTFAWFTDSVTSAGNIIKSGTLDVTMEWADGKESPDSAAWKDASKGAIFDYSKWEPGFTQVRHIKIANKGTLALKYQIKIVVNNKVENLKDLAEVIDVYFVDPATQVADRTALNGIEPIGTLAEVLAGMPGNASGDLNAGDSNMVTLALKMQESAGNEYQDKSIGTDFSVQLVATQDTVESDSFNDQYDVDAEYPLVASGKKALNKELILPYDETNVQIVVPAEAHAGNYAKVVTYENLTEENGKYTFAADFAAEFNGEKADPAFDYEVNLQLPKFVDIEKITHNGNEIPLDEYDPFTGEVTFYTNSFSPFEVTYTELAENPTTEGRTITGGIFYVDPVDFDPSLDEDNSKYIAVEYLQDDVKHYIVCERATTIIVGDADDEGGNYFTENKNYTIKLLNNNKLQSDAVKLLNAMNHGTLLILPGTYKEQARLEPTTHMDIIGLGDKEEIKLIKVSTTSTSSSHQHLINCNGNTARAEHIQVTIRNLYLDATVYNGSGFSRKENAVVQSIRMSKVKCYDLIVNDGNYPFYVNGKYDARGAYMYVENCKLIGKIATDQTPFAPPCALHYYNLTYSNGANELTTNTTYYKNVKMDHTDWDW